MELERDLRFYLTSLLAIFLATVIGATILLERMAPAIQRILEDNEYSLAANEDMLATLADLEPGPAGEKRFADALARARANITEPEEESALAIVGDNWKAALTGDRAAHQRALASLRELAKINRDAMERADRSAKQLGHAGMWGVVLVGLVGFWMGLTVVRLARRRYIGPLRDLHRTLEMSRDGDHHRRANPGDAGADLRDLCAFVNELLDARDRGRIASTERTADTTALRALLARLLDDRAEPTVVIDADAHVDAANAAAMALLGGEDGDSLRDGLLAVATGGTSPVVASTKSVPGTDLAICALAEQSTARRQGTVMRAILPNALLLAGICGALGGGCKCSSPDAADEDLPLHQIDPDQLRGELTSDEAIERLTDRSLDAYERATTILEQSGPDCAAAAKRLREVVRVDGKVIAEAKLLTDLPDLLERARPILEQRRERTRELTDRLDAATGWCGSDPEVAKVLLHF